MNDRDFLTELQRRKDARKNPCESCDGNGGENNRVCADCLGQGVLLTREEYDRILKLAGYDVSDFDGDDILEAEELFPT